jgi:hypothetical protein
MVLDTDEEAEEDGYALVPASDAAAAGDCSRIRLRDG